MARFETWDVAFIECSGCGAEIHEGEYFRLDPKDLTDLETKRLATIPRFCGPLELCPECCAKVVGVDLCDLDDPECRVDGDVEPRPGVDWLANLEKLVKG